MTRATCIALGWITAAAALAAPAGAPAKPQTSGGAVLSESFDDVTAPALPPGWVAANAQGPDPLWVTDTTHADSAPNAAHIDDPDAVADKWLDSPPIPIRTTAARLSFRHFFDFDWFENGSSPDDADLPIDTYLDGGVLEISIDGGQFTDVITAGGVFPQNGYIGPIQRPANPLFNRAAWSSQSGTFITTVLSLPPAAAGTTVAFRWRMGSGGGNSVYTGWWIDSIQLCDGYACDAIPQPKFISADASGNGVWEPGETVEIDPFYFNNGSQAIYLTGTAQTLTGPPGANYNILASTAGYGTIDAGFLGDCSDTGNCYFFSVNNPSSRPARHWDAQLDEALSNGGSVTWPIHIGASFADVPTSNPFYALIENVFHNGVTGGCDASNYCPGNAALRKQMAVFLLKSKYNSAYVPPPAQGIFADVPASDPFAPWIENLYNLGVTGGCSSSPLQYCPDQTVLRQQMAVFLLKSLLGSSYVPPACTGLFADVPCPSAFADWIEDLHRREIASGCGNGDFCPTNPNTRAQMAAFLVNTFGLRLYGP